MNKQKLSAPKNSLTNKTSFYVFIRRLLIDLKKDYWLYIFLIPGILYFYFFHIRTLGGLLWAFKKFVPGQTVWEAEFIGFSQFEIFFNSPDFLRIFENTLVLALSNIVFFFPLPIIMALMINEIVSTRYKRFVQTVTYLPYFLSWMVIGGITFMLFTVDGGAINSVLNALGFEEYAFLVEEEAFLPMIIGQQIWKDVGWGTIIFLSAITSIDPALYEAAAIDGASRFQRILKITLPGMAATISVVLILRMGTFLNTNLDQLFVMVNDGNRLVGETFDTYIYSMGIAQGRFSYTTAVGLFKSLISLIMVAITDFASKKLGGDGLM